MKKHLFKSILVLMVLLFCSTHVFGGDNCDFWQDNPAAMTFTANGNSKTMSFSKSSGVSDYTDIGTVSSLTISSFWVKTWKKNGNVCQIEMYYAIHTTKNAWAGDDSDKHQLNALHDGSYTDWQGTGGEWNQQWLYTGSENMLTGLTPGTTYWIDFYFEIEGNSGGSEGCHDQQKIMNNGGNNFHASFTYASEETTFTAGDYFYLDARNQSNWQSADFTARFYFKRYDTGADISDVTCTNLQKIEDWVYYAVIPSGDYNGKLQIDRVNPAKLSETWCQTPVMAASGRSSALENCLGGSGSECGWTPSWTTYCPPKETSTINDNGTVKYSIDGLEDGTSSHPWLVEKNTAIKVSAASTNYVEDGNMSTKYHFYDNTTSKSGEQSEATYQFTASSSADVTYQMRVNSYNKYNGETSSDKYSESKYYKTVTCYTVTYYGNGSGSGSVPAVSGSKYAATANVTVAGNTGSLGRSNYSFDGWNTNEHITGTAYAASSTISSISGNVNLYAKWNQSVTLDDNSGKGDGSSSVTMTYNASTHTSITNPTRDGYTFSGWYEATDGDALVINTAGVLQPSTSYTDASGYWTRSGAAPTLHAHWTEATLTFKATTNSNWSTATNWTPNCVPTIEHNVVIQKPVIVDVTDARAKSVVLDQHSGNTGSLTISAGQELVIAGTLCKKTDVSEDAPTAAEDVVINSDASNGLGGLVMGSHDGTNKATVNFYSKSHGTKGSSASVAQYLGVPFSDATVLSAFYNSWVYQIHNTDLPDIYWARMNGNDALQTFKGYCVISAENEVETVGGHYYWMQGTLVSSETQNCLLYHFPQTGPDNPVNETLRANSWMAPIKIKAFLESDFTDAVATIYIFNAGSANDWNDNKDEETGYDGRAATDDAALPGQYSVYPISSTSDTAVIPAMQSFSVYTAMGLAASGNLQLDYSRLVYGPARDKTASIIPNKSPRRAKAETSEREEMLLCVRGANGPADRVRILTHEDFDEGFENGWDGHKIFGESFTPQLYAMTPDGNMAVNCIPDFEGTVLGFQAGNVDSSYTFYFRYDGAETLYLNDLKAEESTLIADENAYSFISDSEDAEARFVISATPIHKTPTGVGEVQGDNGQGTKARKLFINGALYIIRSGRMYDVLGKTITHHE